MYGAIQFRENEFRYERERHCRTLLQPTIVGGEYAKRYTSLHAAFEMLSDHEVFV
jgi:hypothetical protein